MTKSQKMKYPNLNEQVGILAEMYGQIVSYYDTIGDPVKYYFLEKIQVTITRHTFAMINKHEESPKH